MRLCRGFLQFCALLLGLLANACRAPKPVPPVAAEAGNETVTATSVRTDSQAYTVRDTVAYGWPSHGIVVISTFRNRSGGRVYVPASCLVQLQKWISNAWVSVYDRHCIPGRTYWSVEAGDSLTRVTPFFASKLPDKSPRFLVDSLPGIYRVEWGAYAARANRVHQTGDSGIAPSTSLPLSARVSNSFTVSSARSSR